MTTTTKPTLAEIAAAAGMKTYPREYSVTSKLEHAARMLDGRTHYLDGGNRRLFGSRVNTITTDEHKTILGIVESVRPPTGPRIYRAVIFDITGEVIHKTEEKTAHGFTGHRSGRAADRELFAWFDQADPATILRDAIRREQDAAERRADELKKAALILDQTTA